MSYRTKLLCSIVGLAVVTCSLVTFLSVSWSGNQFFEQIQREVLSIAVTSAQQVSGDRHREILTPGQEETPAYQEIEGTLRQIRDMNRDAEIDVAYIYTMRPKADTPEAWEFVVDAEEPGEDKSLIGDEFTFEADSDEDRDLTLTGPAYVDQAFTHDEYGSWLSAHAPVRDSNGRVVARLGVDLSAEDIQERQSRLLMASSAALLIAVLLAIVIGFILSSWANRPLLSISSALSKIGSGELQTRIAPVRSDEFGAVQQAVNRMAQSLQEREALAGALTRYVSRDVAREVIERQDSPGMEGTRKSITVLFLDIRGFTSLADSTNAEEVVALLNEFFTEMVNVVFSNFGTLDKFTGDGLMATFGVSGEEVPHQTQAVKSAIEMNTSHKQLIAKWQAEGRPGFRIGIGVHSGPAIVGDMGSEKRMERTAVGKTVNIASRIESANKEFQTTCLISESTRLALPEEISVREVGKITPRGLKEGLTLFALPAIDDDVKH